MTIPRGKERAMAAKTEVKPFDLNPDFVTYRARTTREIPIVVLTPV